MSVFFCGTRNCLKFIGASLGCAVKTGNARKCNKIYTLLYIYF